MNDQAPRGCLGWLMVSLRHKKAATGSNNPNREVSKTAWNDEHALTGSAGNMIVFDGTGTATEVSYDDLAARIAALEAGGTLPPLAPTNSVAPVISGTAVQGSTLTLTSTGVWANSPTAYTQQWKRDGANIVGQTGATYLLSLADFGTTITCSVTASNAGGPSLPATSNGIGPIASLTLGTLAAPTLGYPSPLTTSPYTIPASIPIDWQSGDVFKLAYASDVAFTTPTVLTHTISDADIVAGTISMGIPSGSGVRYHRAYGAHAGVDSAYVSNIVAWGDAIAPAITTSTTQTVTETLPLAVALTATDTSGVVLWTIDSGSDQLQFEINGSTLRWVGSGSKLYSDAAQDGSHVFNVTVRATDYAGNSSTQAIAVTVAAADLTPNAFTFTDVSNATLSTGYSSNTVTISGLGTGINAPLSVTGGTVSKNGGTGITSGTIQNGDTIQALATSSGSYSTAVNVAVTVGTYTDTYTVTSQADPSRAAFFPSSVQPDWQNNTATTYTFTGADFVAGGLGVVYTAPGGGAATAVKIKAAGVAGADISLVSRVAGSSGFDQHIWVCPDASPIVTSGTYNVEVTMGSANQDMAVMCGTVTGASTGVPTSVARLNAYVSTSTPTATSALTISATGVGVAFCYGNGNVTASNGTHLTQGIGNWGGGGTSVKNGAISRNSTTGSWTPAFTTAGGGGAAMLCATWDH